MNGDTPEVVVISYEQYKKLGAGERVVEKINPVVNKQEQPVGSSTEQTSPDDDRVIEKLNREILALKEEIKQKESAELEDDQVEPNKAEEEEIEKSDFLADVDGEPTI